MPLLLGSGKGPGQKAEGTAPSCYHLRGAPVSAGVSLLLGRRTRHEVKGMPAQGCGCVTELELTAFPLPRL